MTLLLDPPGTITRISAFLVPDTILRFEADLQICAATKPAESISPSLVRKYSYNALTHADLNAVNGDTSNTVSAEVVESCTDCTGLTDILLSSNGFQQLTGMTTGSATVDWQLGRALVHV
jgi:hypothetical protein